MTCEHDPFGKDLHSPGAKADAGKTQADVLAVDDSLWRLSLEMAGATGGFVRVEVSQ